MLYVLIAYLFVPDQGWVDYKLTEGVPLEFCQSMVKEGLPDILPLPNGVHIVKSEGWQIMCVQEPTT